MGSTSRVISNIVIFHPSFTNCVFAEECVREEEVWNFFLSQPRKSRLISCQISTFRGNKSQQFVKPFFFFYRLVRKTLYTHLSRPFTNFTSIDQLRDTRQRIVESRLIVRLKSATRVEKQRVACDFSSPTAMKRLGCQRQVCVSSDLNLPVYSGFDQPKRGCLARPSSSSPTRDDARERGSVRHLATYPFVTAHLIH